MKKFASMLLGSVWLIAMAGCGGESTHDKMMRMAQERSKIRAAEKSRVEEMTDAKAANADSPTPTQSPQKADPQQLASKADVKPKPVEPPTKIQKADPSPAEAKVTETVANETPETAAVAVKPPRSKARSEEDEEQLSATTVAEPSTTEPLITSRLLAFSKQDQQAAIVGENGGIGIYDVPSKRLTRRIFNSELEPSSIAIDDDGSLLAVGGKNGHLKIFPLGTVNSFDKFQQIRLMRRDAMPPSKAHETMITAVAVSSQSGLAASGDKEGQIKLWRDSGQSAFEIKSDAEAVTLMVRSDDGKALIGASEARLFHWIPAKEGFELGVFDGLRASGPITALAVWGPRRRHW